MADLHKLRHDMRQHVLQFIDFSRLKSCDKRDGGLEIDRIVAHLSHVEQSLRSRATSHLAEPTRQARLRHLDNLRMYWQAERFPHNHHEPIRVPCFIDEHDRRCAVAELLIQDGQSDLAYRIARTMKNLYLPDMHDDELFAWVESSGLTAEELAWIQPTYDPDWNMRGACEIRCAFECDSYAATYEWFGGELAPRTIKYAKDLPIVAAIDPKGDIIGMTQDRRLGRIVGKEWSFDVEIPQSTATRALEKFRQGEIFWFMGDDIWIGAGWKPHAEHWTLEGHEAVIFAPSSALPERGSIYGIGGTNPTDVWFSAGNGLIHWNGKNVQEVDLHAIYDKYEGYFGPIWAAGVNNLWVGGLGKIVHWQNGPYTVYDLESDRFTTRIKSIWGSGPDDVWAVGERNGFDRAERVITRGNNKPVGVAYHWNGRIWKSIAFESPILQVLGHNEHVWLMPRDQCQHWTQSVECLANQKAACKTFRTPVPPAAGRARLAVGNPTPLPKKNAPILPAKPWTKSDLPLDTAPAPVNAPNPSPATHSRIPEQPAPIIKTTTPGVSNDSSRNWTIYGGVVAAISALGAAFFFRRNRASR